MKLRILIVEDNRAHSRSLDLKIDNDERIKADYEGISSTLVECASDAHALLTKADQTASPYDILLLDLELPETPGGPVNMKYGLEILRLSREKRAATSVIVISQYTELVRPAIQAWATGMVDKPYDHEEIVNTILVSWERTKKEMDSQAVRNESGSLAHFTSLPARLFLAYARQDEDQAAILYKKLNGASFIPWMEVTDTLPGQNKKYWRDRAIQHSDFVLVCLSSGSATERGPLQSAIREAIELWEEKRDDDIFLIPVLLNPCLVPESLQQFQYAKLYEEDGWERLVRSIHEGMKLRPLTGQPQHH